MLGDERFVQMDEIGLVLVVEVDWTGGAVRGGEALASGLGGGTGFPSGVTGPGDFFPLARQAAIRRVEDIVGDSRQLSPLRP